MSKIVLNGITWKNPRGYDPLARAAQLWNQKFPDVQINWEQLPWYEFEDKIFAALAKDNSPFDFIMFDHPWTGKLANDGKIIAWNELMGDAYIQQLDERVVKPSTASYSMYGQQWALPLDAACHTGLYRNDLLNGGTLPTTWETMAEWASAHTSSNYYPLVLCVEGVLGSCLFLSMMAGLGYPAFADEETPKYDRAAAEHIIALLKDLLKFTPPGSAHLGPWDIYNRFIEKDDMLFSPSIFAYVNYFGQDERKQHLRLCKVPDFASGKKGKAILGGVGLAVAKSCKWMDEAKRFGEYLMSEEVQLNVFPPNFGQPATVSAWENAPLNKTFNHFYNDLSLSMENAYIRPRYPTFHKIELLVGSTLQDFWDNKVNLRDTLDTLDKIPSVI